MGTLNESKPPPRPGATADAEAAALNAQALEAGTTDQPSVVELLDEAENGSADAKKPPQAGLKNYFVSC